MSSDSEKFGWLGGAGTDIVPWFMSDWEEFVRACGCYCLLSFVLESLTRFGWMSFVLFLWLGFDGRAVEVVAAAFFSLCVWFCPGWRWMLGVRADLFQRGFPPIQKHVRQRDSRHCAAMMCSTHEARIQSAGVYQMQTPSKWCHVSQSGIAFGGSMC